MKLVSKYNTFKAMSLALSAGAPIGASMLFSDFLVKSTDTSISTAAIVALLIAALVCKDKLLEEIKSPTAFKVSAVLLVIIFVIESILVPIKWILLITVVALGIDTLFIKRIYTIAEAELPDIAVKYKRFGFIFCKTDTLIGDNNECDR